MSDEGEMRVSQLPLCPRSLWRLGVLAVQFGLFAAAAPVAAQGYKPSRPVEFIVHGGPGSGVDVTARFVNGVLEFRRKTDRERVP